MKLVLAIVIMGIMVFSTGAYGQTPAELGYRFLPNKIVANTDVVLEVYAKDDNIPHNVDNLIATSSDSSIIQVVSVEKAQNDFTTTVKIKSLNAGSAMIDLAAPGFASQEIPVIVYSDNKAPTKLLIKITPNTFSTIGSEKGYVSVELSNDAGIPIKARQDTSITLTTDSNIINLHDSGLIIKAGDYFAIAQFDVKKDGIAKILAAAPYMITVSDTVTVSTSENQKTIQMYVFPTILNSHQNSYGYVIAQLQLGGIPVLATEDITIPVQVVNASGVRMINTSGENPQITANAPIVIKKGSYWGYTQISVAAGTMGQWNVGLTAKDYLISPTVQITTTDGPLLDDHTAVLDTLPILATGQKELIGIMHLEDDSVSPPNPVIAKSDLQIEVDSSDTNTLSVDKVAMDRGTGSALVFGKVGTTVPIQPQLHVVTASPPSVSQTYATVISAPISSSLALVAAPLLPSILTDNNFPLALYMTKSGKIDYFPQDMGSFVSPSTDVFQTESKTLPQGESIVLLNSKSLKASSSIITASAGDFATNISIQSVSSKPALISIDYPDKILANLKNTFSIQLLDAQNNPVFLENDMQFKLVSSDPTILSVPESVVIKKGSYYSLFDIEAIKTGTTELAALTSDLPLAKFNVQVISLVPDVSISSVDYVDKDTVFDATLSVHYKDAPLSGMKVDWNVKGARIQNMDSLTDKDGNAKISLLSQDPATISLEYSVSGGAFSATAASKTINVNQPLQTSVSPNTALASTSSLFGINPMFIVIPVAAAAAGGIIILKKKNMLDGITEKINIMEKVSGIKERITQLREK